MVITCKVGGKAASKKICYLHGVDDNHEDQQ